jgi:hypothetical protein
MIGAELLDREKRGGGFGHGRRSKKVERLYPQHWEVWPKAGIPNNPCLRVDGHIRK